MMRRSSATPRARFGARVLACAIVAASVVACGPPQRPDAWRHTDLWTRAPTILNPVAERPRPLQGELATMQGRAIRVLNAMPGETLVWRVELGMEPSLTVRAIAEGGDCWFRVTAEADGERHELVRHIGKPRGHNIAPELGVDLADFAGREIDLELEIGPESDRPCRRARWGSPRITDRGPVAISNPDRPNIVFLGLDTLRTDALGAYGKSPSVTPAIDAFAAHSDVWLDAFTSSNNTNPSFISLMTGLYAKNHGVFNLTSALADSYTTLAETLHGAGYATMGATAATHLGHASGLAQGFDTWINPPRGQFFAETIVDHALGWLDEPRDQPFFLFLHFFDPHVPHNPPARYHVGMKPATRYQGRAIKKWVPFREPGPREFDPRPKLNVKGHADLYPGEVTYLDRQLDRLFVHLESRGLAENTVVVLVADHGETLGERGNYFDHVGLHDNTTHVPLIIHWPGQREGRQIEGLVQHLDLFPTLLGYVGIDAPDSDGRDLVAMRDEGRGRRLVFAQHAHDSGAMVRSSRYKYMVNRSDTLWDIGTYFYDLQNDPDETTNLTGQGLTEEADMALLLERWLADRQAGDGPVAIPITEEDRKRLEALGYSG